MDNQEFEKRIRERLSSYNEMPDSDLENQIFQRIPSNEGLIFTRKTIAIISISACFFILLSLYIFFPTKHLNREKDDSAVAINEKGSFSETQNSLDVSDNSKWQDDKYIALKNEESNTKLNKEELEENSINYGKIQRKNSEKVKKKNDLTKHQLSPEYLESFSYLDWHLQMPDYFHFDKVSLIEFTERKPEDKPSMFKFYFYTMPTINYYRVEANEKDNIMISGIEKVPTLSTDRLGFRVESGVNYDISNRWSLFTGILYFYRKQTINYSVRSVNEVRTEVMNETAFLIPEYSEAIEEHESVLRSLGFQIGALYDFSSDKFVQNIGTGIEFHYNLNKPVDSKNQFEDPANYVFYNVFYRLEYPRESQFKFLFQPTFNYSLNISKNLDAPFYVKPYGIGLNFGFTYQF